MEIFCSLPVPRSFAETCRMPFASMSKVTSICGTPRGAGGMPSRWNVPSFLLSRGHRALALQDVDLHARLVIAVGRKDLRLAGRDRRVARNHRSGHAAGGLDRQRQRRHVEQQHVLHVPLQTRRPGWLRLPPRLRPDSRPCAVPCRSTARRVDDLWHTGHAADEHELVDFLLRSSGVFQQRLRLAHRALEQIVVKAAPASSA